MTQTHHIIQPRLRRRLFQIKAKSSIEYICRKAGLNIEELRKQTRKADYAQRRQAIMAFMHLRMYSTFSDSGRLFGKDHATALHATNRVKDEIEIIKKYPNMSKSIRLMTYEQLVTITNK